MKYSLIQNISIFIFSFVISLSFYTGVFASDNYCITAIGACVEQPYDSARFGGIDNCVRTLPHNVSQQVCQQSLQNFSFCLSDSYKCEVVSKSSCDSDSGTKFPITALGSPDCQLALSEAQSYKYCRCNPDRSSCTTSASDVSSPHKKELCETQNQSSSGQYTQCIKVGIGDNCSSLVVSEVRKFCACSSDKSLCDSKQYNNKQLCESAISTVNSNSGKLQCFALENNTDCQALVAKDSSDSSSNSNGNTGNSNSDLLSPLRDKIEGLNKTGVDSVNLLIANVIKTAMGILGSIALVMIIYGGLTFMLSAGNGDKRKKAINILVWSVLGVVLIFASYAIISLVFETFK